MNGPKNRYGIVHSNEDLFLTEEPVETDRGVYAAEAIDLNGNIHEVELEGWGDGDFDYDSPLDVW